MNLLEQVYFGNPLYDWIVAVTISIVLVLILHIVKRIILRRLTALSRKTENRLDDYVVDILSHTRFLFLFIVAFYFGMQYLELPPKPTRYLDHFAVIALLVQVAFWGNRAIAVWLKDYLKRNRETDAASATTASRRTLRIGSSSSPVTNRSCSSGGKPRAARTAPMRTSGSESRNPLSTVLTSACEKG